MNSCCYSSLINARLGHLTQVLLIIKILQGPPLSNLFCNSIEIVLCKLTRIMLQNPSFTGKLHFTRILLDFIPVRLVPHITGRFASFLNSTNAVVSDAFVNSDRKGDIVFSGSAETDAKSHPILHRLRGSLNLNVREI